MVVDSIGLDTLVIGIAHRNSNQKLAFGKIQATECTTASSAAA
ncbi:hypothetical protein [Rhodoferax sp. OV413]|nr:hypothetical protein [Rhodoferax sp. OV413]